MEEQIARYAPIVRWLPAYDWRASLRFDTFAGLAVWAVLMPQAIAYASLAGAPPQAGFYAAGAAVLLYAAPRNVPGALGRPEQHAGDDRGVDRRRRVGEAGAAGAVLLAALALAAGSAMLAAGIMRSASSPTSSRAR